MRLLWGLFRFLNAMISRLTGALAIPMASLGLGMFITDPGSFTAVFGSDLAVAIGLAALLSIGGVLLLPSLTERFFHGPRRGRRRRAVLHLVAVGAALALSALVVRTALTPAAYAAYAPLMLQAGLAVLGTLALSWLAPATGLDARARHEPVARDATRNRAALRSLRHRRTPPPIGT